LDLPCAGNISILIEGLDEKLANVTVRKYQLASTGLKYAKPQTIKVPLWDPFLIEEYIYGILLPAFKWLQLFKKNSNKVLSELVQAQISVLTSDKYVLEFTTGEAEMIKQSVRAAVGAHLKELFNAG
jgi:hypothetical protein